MLINLSAEAQHDEFQLSQFTFTERLPENTLKPCTVDVSYLIKDCSNHFLIQLILKANLALVCQRCLDQFNYFYQQDMVVAAYRTETEAEAYLGMHETVVAANNLVDLKELVLDELHLSALRMHPNRDDCNQETIQFI